MTQDTSSRKYNPQKQCLDTISKSRQFCSFWYELDKAFPCLAMARRGAREIRGFLLLSFCFLLCAISPALADDSETSRRTLTGLQGVKVLVEELQPNILNYDKYLQKAGLSKAKLQKNVETKLKAAGIKILSGDEWLKTPGKPVLYVNVNTHENEKYWFAYDINLELRQVVSLESRPEIKTLANTWGVNMTGVVNIGTFNVITDNLAVLVGRFAAAYKAVNGK